MGLPLLKDKSIILVVVDRLSKYAHFVPIPHIHIWLLLALQKLLFDPIFAWHAT